jgi:hypothetical protein
MIDMPAMALILGLQRKCSKFTDDVCRDGKHIHWRS